MEFAFYYTEVTWCWWEGSVRKTAQEAVVVCATSHSQAAGIVEENYGEELVSIDKIEQISEDKTLPLSILSGRALRDAAIDYGAAEVIEEKDFNKKKVTVHMGPDDSVSDLPKGVEWVKHTNYDYVNKIPKAIHWNPNTSAFPTDVPRGTIIVCDTSSTYAQNWEGVAP